MSLKTMLTAITNLGAAFSHPAPINLTETIGPSYSRPRNRALPRSRTPGSPSSSGTKLVRKAHKARLTLRHC